MKIIITGSLGHISKPLTQELVRRGHTLTVISSNPEKQIAIEASGAHAAIGSLEDADFLAETFTGADAVYTMVPPTSYFNPELDLKAYCRTIANSYVRAIQLSGVKRIVNLSSIGAHLENDSGIILAHRAVELILNKLSDVAITHMRPTSFYYNLFSFLDVIKNTGFIMANYGAEDMVVWVSPIDIAVAVAEELETPLIGRKIRYVASEERTGNEVASILGTAIGQPDLKWKLITDEQMQQSLESIGMPAQNAAGLVEMNASIHSGIFFEDYFLNRPSVIGQMKLTQFAQEFAAAFNQK